MIDIKDLKRGDIIVIFFNGKPYHFGFYTPNENEIGDFIHMGFGLKRSGLIKSTVAKTIHEHQHFMEIGQFFHPSQQNKITVKVIRSKTLEGEALAKQAESWLSQGVTYDEKRTLYGLENFASDDKNYDVSEAAQA